jgi:tellurium resistance protein TerD
MAITLNKGGNVSLSKEDPSLKRIIVGLGWDARATDGASFDLDASAFLLNSDNKVRADNDFIFYNNLKSSDGSITHNGDNRTGDGEGDDESIGVNLLSVSASIEKIAFCVTIHEAEIRKQNFGQIQAAFIRIINADSQKELVRFDLSEDMSIETAMVFGELYRHNGEWKFRAVGQGFKGGLSPLAQNYGVNIG